jgi:hypothetical protein
MYLFEAQCSPVSGESLACGAAEPTLACDEAAGEDGAPEGGVPESGVRFVPFRSWSAESRA